MSRFSGLGAGFLLDDDIAGIQFIYGSGIGSVTPRQEEDEPQDPDRPDDEDPQASNEITAELDEETGLMRLQGDSMDNSLLVYSTRWFSLVLGIDETTINGERGAFWMQLGGQIRRNRDRRRQRQRLFIWCDGEFSYCRSGGRG